jgi:tetratricopeptide (TPR) repeat protein
MAQINPSLIHQLTGKPLNEIPESPTPSWIPGTLGKLVNKHKEKIERLFEENHFMITCRSCGRKGKYDVGLMVINADVQKEENSADRIQTTGYFRCKHCNDAGNWELPADFYLASLGTTLGKLASFDTGEKSTFGKNLLYDGSWHLYSTDAEEYLLGKLRETPDSSFIWNRLGNLYHKGGRPELAASVFEHSLSIDPAQVESHYTLAGFLRQIKEYEKSAFHFKQMLLHASSYTEIPAKELREILSVGLQSLLWMSLKSDGSISFLPSAGEAEAAGKKHNFQGKSSTVDLEIIPEELDSFYPIAEMYMGPLRKRLPKSLRTFSPQPAGQKKKKKRKKRKK